MSPARHAAMIAPTIGIQVGERVIAYVDHHPRRGLRARIARTRRPPSPPPGPNGFAMTISATPRKRDKLAAQLTWLANRHILNLPEDRRHGRFVPRNQGSTLLLPNGSVIGCRIIDVSLSGAGIAVPSALRPEIGAVVTLGKVTGRVVRHLEEGFAIEFTRLQHPDLIEESVAAQF